MAREYKKGDFNKLETIRVHLHMEWPDFAKELGYSHSGYSGWNEQDGCPAVALLAAEALAMKRDIGMKQIFFILSCDTESEATSLQAFCKAMSLTIHGSIKI